jgi:hypothetical protein
VHGSLAPDFIGAAQPPSSATKATAASIQPNCFFMTLSFVVVDVTRSENHLIPLKNLAPGASIEGAGHERITRWSLFRLTVRTGRPLGFGLYETGASPLYCVMRRVMRPIAVRPALPCP